MREIECGGAHVGDLDVVAKFVQRLEQAHNIRTSRIVTEQNVSDSGNESILHKIFATPILRPEGSNAWQAQAMHGSNECTVRNTSSGSSGFAKGVFSNDAS